MARSDDERAATERPETGSSQAVPNSEDLKRKVEDFGDQIQKLKEQGTSVSKEWLAELERRQQSLRNSLEHYSKEQGGQLAKGSQLIWETTKRQADWMLTAADRQVQTNFQNLRDYVDRNQDLWTKGANEFAEAVRKPWVDLANAFDGVFGRAQVGPSAGKGRGGSDRQTGSGD
jgi:hypothetical protein